MNNKFWLAFFLVSFMTACGGGGGSSSYSSSSSSSSGGSSSSTLTNLNPANACKKAWYTTMPTASSTNGVFNNYSFFWQATSFEAMPICENYYEATTSIISTGGISWKTYVNELLEYSKNTLGQIVPINVFILGANPQNSVTASEKATYNTDFATVQAPLSDYSNALANYDGFPIDSAGGGYSHEAAPNGADVQIPQSLVWGQAGFANDAEQIQQSFKIIAHEYFHVYQNSIKFYNEASKTISLPKAWFSNPSLLDPASATTPAYFPWYIEEGGAEFGGIVLSAKYANTKAGITTNPAQQFEDHFGIAFDYFDGDAGRSLADFNLTGNVGYSAGASALLYLWSKDERNFNAAMSKYYTSWQEAELLRSGNGWQDAFEDVFWKNSTEYYTLSEFVTEFNTWIRSNTKTNLWNAIAKTSSEIIHADIIPTTVNTPNAASKTIQVLVDSNPFGAGNRYFIDGVVKKTLVVKAGQTYKFNIPNQSGHPFKFSTTENGTHGGGIEYTTNVTTSGTEVSIVIPSTGVSALYYYCEIHSGMGGKIIVSEQGYSGGGGIGGGEGIGY
tara:strand:- start:1049 stop:2725 length:1677 start_codon:yes stop_codon:yes gene_type:complete